MPFRVNERLSVDGQLCTIRYVGRVPNWPDQEALGIEWDDPDRGKHDGELDGIRYFHTKLAKSGSFIKSNSKKIARETVSFMEAVIDQYGLPFEESEEIRFGKKVAQSYGFEKLTRMQSDFSNLKVISINRKLVASSGGGVVGVFPSLTNLDMSFNLFNDWSQIWNIIDEIPNLNTLILNGNRFIGGRGDCVDMKEVGNLRVLGLSTTMVNNEDLEMLKKKFPNLEELILAANYFDEDTLDTDIFTSWNTLRRLDLSYNQFKKVPYGLKKSTISSLMVSNNQIVLEGEINVWDRLEELDLRINKIEDWSEIDTIFKNFPNLHNLRINNNPLFDTISIEEMQLNIIARIGDRLTMLNGGVLMKDEIVNSEMYFISKVNQNVFNYDKTSTRWASLVKKYDVKEETHTDVHETNLSSKLLQLEIRTETMSMKRIILRDSNILKLRGIISKIIHRSPLDLELSYYITTVENQKIRKELADELALVSAFNFDDNEVIYVGYRLF